MLLLSVQHILRPSQPELETVSYKIIHLISPIYVFIILLLFSLSLKTNKFT